MASGRGLGLAVAVKAQSCGWGVCRGQPAAGGSSVAFKWILKGMSSVLEMGLITALCRR